MLRTATVENVLANNVNSVYVNIKRSTKLQFKFNNTIIIQKITPLEEDRCVSTKSEYLKLNYIPILLLIESLQNFVEKLLRKY